MRKKVAKDLKNAIDWLLLLNDSLCVGDIEKGLGVCNCPGKENERDAVIGGGNKIVICKKCGISLEGF
jgi:hypothetical protein